MRIVMQIFWPVLALVLASVSFILYQRVAELENAPVYSSTVADSTTVPPAPVPLIQPLSGPQVVAAEPAPTETLAAPMPYLTAASVTEVVQTAHAKWDVVKTEVAHEVSRLQATMQEIAQALSVTTPGVASLTDAIGADISQMQQSVVQEFPKVQQHLQQFVQTLEASLQRLSQIAPAPAGHELSNALEVLPDSVSQTFVPTHINNMEDTTSE